MIFRRENRFKSDCKPFFLPLCILPYHLCHGKTRNINIKPPFRLGFIENRYLPVAVSQKFIRKADETLAHLKTKLRKLLAVFVAASMLNVGPVFTVHAQDGGTSNTSNENSSINQDLVAGVNREDTYASYYNSHSDAGCPDKEIVIEAKSFKTAKDDNGVEPEVSTKEFEGEKDAVVWTNHGGTLEYTFNVAETGLYNLEMLYYTISGNNTVIELAMKIDDEFPFSAAKTFTLDRYWKDESAITKDSRDNDIRPGQVGYISH